MTPTLAYTLNGTAKTFTFSPEDFTLFTQDWEEDEIEYKNPFTGFKTRKRRGYYYKATIAYDAADYALLSDMKDIFDVGVADMKFYPNSDNEKECFDVDVNDTLSTEDSDVAQSVKNLEITFRSKRRYQSPLNQPVGYWGDRRHSFNDYAGLTFADIH